MPTPKEKVYDSEINPLMAQIIAVCKREHIAVLATFAIDGPEDIDLRSTTCLPGDNGEFPDDIREAYPILYSGR
jgi:hypothetical protein